MAARRRIVGRNNCGKRWVGLLAQGVGKAQSGKYSGSGVCDAETRRSHNKLHFAILFGGAANQKKIFEASTKTCFFFCAKFGNKCGTKERASAPLLWGKRRCRFCIFYKFSHPFASTRKKVEEMRFGTAQNKNVLHVKQVGLLLPNFAQKQADKSMQKAGVFTA